MNSKLQWFQEKYRKPCASIISLYFGSCRFSWFSPLKPGFPRQIAPNFPQIALLRCEPNCADNSGHVLLLRILGRAGKELDHHQKRTISFWSTPETVTVSTSQGHKMSTSQMQKIRITMDIYHLVMTNSLPWKNPPIFQFGKPSISIRAIYTVAMLNTVTRG